MICDITITEKSFGPKVLMTGVKFSVDEGEKVGVVGRNGIGKSTLFGILAGTDTDFTGDVIYRRGVSVVSTAQEHHGHEDQTVVEYVLAGLPEYPDLAHIIHSYPLTMGDDMKLIDEYTEALDRFEQKGFYQIEEQIERELANFQMPDVAARPLSSLSGGQRRMVEVVKVMHSDAHLALIDEPTNHMDYVAKDQFISWMKRSDQAMLIITHDRDVLREVDRIVELKDGGVQSFKGNYDAYLKQNAVHTGSAMNEFEMIEKRIANLKVKILDYQRLKEKARNPATIQKFKRLEQVSRAELAELQTKEKPTFWIDKESVENLSYKVAGQYQKFKARNIKMNIKGDESRSKRVLVRARDLALGYGDTLLFDGIDIDLREGEAIELRGRNGAGKSTLIKALLGGSTFDTATSKHAHSRHEVVSPSSLQAAELASLRQSSPGQEAVAKTSGLDRNVSKSQHLTPSQARVASTPLPSSPILQAKSPRRSLDTGPVSRSAPSFEKSEILSKAGAAPPTATRLEADDSATTEGESKHIMTLFDGEITLDPQVRVGVYEQEVSARYFDLSLHDAIERMYLDKNLSITTTKVRQLLADYLFTESDGHVPLAKLSGGQKARFQIITMLANDPQLLILDEPTNHLDLPSIEELETALEKYSGAVLYVSHDGYFREKLGGDVIQIGSK